MLWLEDVVIVRPWRQDPGDSSSGAPRMTADCDQLFEIRPPIHEVIVDVDDRRAGLPEAGLQTRDSRGDPRCFLRQAVAALEVEQIDHVDDQQGGERSRHIVSQRYGAV